MATTLLGAAGEDLKAKLINSDLDPGIQKGIKDTNISSIIASGSNNLEDARQYVDFKIRQAKNELELLKLKNDVKSEASKLAVGAATLACSTAGFIFGVATYATTSAIKNHPEYLASFMDGLAKGLSASGEVHTRVNQLTKELVGDRTDTEFTKALNDEIAKNTNDVVRTLERKVYAVGKALQE